LLTGLLLLTSTSCGTSRTPDRSKPDYDTKNLSSPDAALSGSASSRQIVQLSKTGAMSYKIPQAALASALIRQFHDGTVIDRVLVHKAPGDPGDKPVYYLVGTGMNAGHYRAIALPLRGTDDGTYYLTPNADRYILSSSGCLTCYYDFEDGHIIGSTCDDNVGGGGCTLRVLAANEVFMRQ